MGNGNTNGKLISLRIAEYGDEFDSRTGNFGNDYYLGYNHASGPNTGTLEAKNKVTLFRKDTGGPDGYGEGNRIADLSVGQSHKIENFKDTSFDVIIRVQSFSNNNKDAIIEITTLGDGVPTAAPTASCGGVGRFQLELNIDTYAYETAWELLNDETNEIIASAPKENHLSQRKYVYPPEDEGEYYCLEEGCYTYKITDTYGDGLNFGEGDYMGYLDGEIAFKGDGNFNYEMTHKFCVEGVSEIEEELPTPTLAPVSAPTSSPTKEPTPEPTNTPTKAPTKAPTTEPTNTPTKAPTPEPINSPTKAPVKEPTNAPVVPPTEAPVTVNVQPTCIDDVDFLWKGRAQKDCEWAGKGSDTQTKRKCKRNNGDGKKVFDYCPMTCALHDLGPCA